jgi:hypothetical protein
VYNYYSCARQETNPRIKAIWERFLDYELGHFEQAVALFKQYERRDPAEVFSGDLPEPIEYASHRDFVRQVLAKEVDLRTKGPNFVDKRDESQASIDYRMTLNANGSPSETVAAGYIWAPGTELNRKVAVAV